MKFYDVTKLSDLLSIIEPQKEIIKYLMSLKERGLSYNSVSLALYAIYHFYEMNDIALNKKKINMFKGEFTRKVSDRAYTHEEIRKILDISDLRMKSIVLLMASSGIRIGSIPLLKFRNFEKIDYDSTYKITVYEGTNDQYYNVAILILFPMLSIPDHSRIHFNPNMTSPISSTNRKVFRSQLRKLTTGGIDRR